MATIAHARLRELLAPFHATLTPGLLDQLGIYLDLLVRWNDRTNLTAIRDPEQMVTRHFGESLFAAAHLPAGKTLLDIGSGAGFPGLPVQLARPALRVTLAESQGKKASFLREVIRTLQLPTEVWSRRVEDLPPERRFDLVTLRAVDRPGLALEAARLRVSPGGTLGQLASFAPKEPDVIYLPASERRGFLLSKL